MTYEEFQEEVRSLKRARWAQILAAEPPGRPAGRRPRDPRKERLLIKLDRARLAREEVGVIDPAPDAARTSRPRRDG